MWVEGLDFKVCPFVVVQSLNCVRRFAIPWTAARQAPLSSTISQTLLKLMLIELMMLSNYLILCGTPSPFAFNLFQHWGFIQWVSSSHQVAKVLELQFQQQSFLVNIQSCFPLGLTGLISLQSKGLSRVFSSTTIPWHQYFGAQPSLWSSSHIHTWSLEKP